MQMDNIIEDAINFMKPLMDAYGDESHNSTHALRVLYGVNYMLSGATPERKLRVRLAAIFHDVRDHKYKDVPQISEEDLISYLEGIVGLPDAKIIVKICNNVSWSRFARGETEDLGEYNEELAIVQTADRLDALGITGGLRCMRYQQRIGSSLPQDMVKHAHEKLFKLKDHMWGEWAKERAQQLHDELREFIRGIMCDYTIGMVLLGNDIPYQDINLLQRLYLETNNREKKEEYRRVIRNHIEKMSFEELESIMVQLST
jgi:uncharacterized protein